MTPTIQAKALRFTLGVPDEPTEEDVRYLLSLMVPVERLHTVRDPTRFDLSTLQSLIVRVDHQFGVRFADAT
jgi:hypothetical protein